MGASGTKLSALNAVESIDMTCFYTVFASIRIFFFRIHCFGLVELQCSYNISHDKSLVVNKQHRSVMHRC